MSYKLQFPSFNIKIKSYKLQHQKHNLKSQHQKHKLRVTTSKAKVTSYNVKSTSYKLRVTTSKAQVTSYNIKSTSYNITRYELRHYTVIHLIKGASLIEDAPKLKSQFPCEELQVMKKGKLPNRRRTLLLEYFMSSFVGKRLL